MAKKAIFGKLPKRFKNRWLKALRSGKFEQGNNYLYNGETYCCLGVASCIATGNKPKQGQQYISERNLKTPKILRGGNNLTDLLADMNDGRNRFKMSFKSIANWIEKNL